MESRAGSRFDREDRGMEYCGGRILEDCRSRRKIGYPDTPRIGADRFSIKKEAKMEVGQQRSEAVLF